MSPILLLTANRMPLLKLHDHGHRHWDKAGPPAHSRGKSPGSSASSETARLGPAQRDATRRQRQHPTAQGLRRRYRRPESDRSASSRECRPFRIAPRGGAARGYPASTIPPRTHTRRCTLAPLSRCTRQPIPRRGRGGARGARGLALARGTRVGLRWMKAVSRMDGIPMLPGALDMWGFRRAGSGERGGSVTREAGSRRCPPWTRTRWRGASRGGPAMNRRQRGRVRAHRRRSSSSGWTWRGLGAGRRGAC